MIHYLLHAYDNTPHASRGLAAARRLAAVAPSSPHAIQFPAHIYVRMGLWEESIDANRAGAAVEDLFFKPHAMDFLVYVTCKPGKTQRPSASLMKPGQSYLPHILDAYAMAAMPARYAINAGVGARRRRSPYRRPNLRGAISRTPKRLWYLPAPLARRER